MMKKISIDMFEMKKVMIFACALCLIMASIFVVASVDNTSTDTVAFADGTEVYFPDAETWQDKYEEISYREAYSITSIKFATSIPDGYTTNWGDGTVKFIDSDSGANKIKLCRKNEDDNKTDIAFVCSDTIYAPANSESLFALHKWITKNNASSIVSNVTSIELDNFDTSKVTNMKNMFYGCRSLTSLNVSDFDTSQVTNLYGMFNNCYGIKELDISSFNTANVETMGYMFSSCSKLEKITFGTYWDTSKVKIFSSMFSGCNKLPSFDLSIFNTSSATDMHDMFRNCDTFASLDLSDFDTTNVTDMSYMFDGCSALTSLEFGDNFDTSNVENMEFMFRRCCSLTNLDLSNFDTSKVTNMSNMFENCYKLESITFGDNFKTSNVTTMSSMFSNCLKLESIELDKFDTSNVTNMSSMFYRSSALENLDLSNFDTSKVTYMSFMFYDCQNLETITFGDKWDTSKVTHMGGMFYNCYSLSSLDLSNFNMENVTYAASMVINIYPYTIVLPYNVQIELPLYYDNYHCDKDNSDNNGSISPSNCSTKNADNSITKSTLTIDGAIFPEYNIWTENFKEITGRYASTITSIKFLKTIEGTGNIYTSVWSGKSGIQYIDNGRIAVYRRSDSLTDIVFVCDKTIYAPKKSWFLFKGDNYSKLKSIEFENFDTSQATTMVEMFRDCKLITSLDLSGFDTSKVTDMQGMFYNCEKIDSLDLSSFDTSNVTTMSSMFYRLSALENLTLGDKWDTSQVTDMSDMFQYCCVLTSIELDKFDTSNVTNMSDMFNNCEKLTSIDLSNWDTSNVTTMHSMFYYCRKVTSITFGNKWNTSNVTDMSWMFYYCVSLKSLDLSKFNTAKVNNMGYMFDECLVLESLDLSSFDTHEVNSMSAMFCRNEKLKSIKFGDNWDTAKVTTMQYMFSNCFVLESIDLTNFTTSNVENMGSMFSSCKAVKSLDVSGFDTSNVTNMVCMFSDCESLTSLDLSNFDMSCIISENDAYGLLDGTHVQTLVLPYNLNADIELSYCDYICDKDNSRNNGSILMEKCSTKSGDTISKSTYTIQDAIFPEASVWQAKYEEITGRKAYEIKSIQFVNERPLDYDSSNYIDEGKQIAIYNNNNYVTFYYTNTIYAPENSSDLFSLYYYDSENSLNVSNVLEIVFSNFDTSRVTNMSNMFAYDKYINSIDLSSIDMSNVTNVDDMFVGTYLNQIVAPYGLTKDLSLTSEYFCDGDAKFDNTLITTAKCSTKTGDVVSKVTYFKQYTITWKNYDGTTLETDIGAYSYDAIYNSATPVNREGGIYYTFDGWNTTVTPIAGDKTYTATFVEMDMLFPTSNIWKSKYEYITSLGVEKITSIIFVNEIPTGYTSKWSGGVEYYIDEGEYIQICHKGGSLTDIAFVYPHTIYAPDNSKNLFSLGTLTIASALTNISFDNFKTSKAVNMANMFSGCSLLTTIDIDGFETDKAENMSGMFNGCSGLTELDVSSFKTTAVKDMSYMFVGCTSLKTLNLCSFNMAVVENTTDMFKGIALYQIGVPQKVKANIALDTTYYSTSTKKYGNNAITPADSSTVTNKVMLLKECPVVWLNDDGTTLTTTVYAYSMQPVMIDDATKPSTEQYSYKFIKWEQCDNDGDTMVFKAVYEANLMEYTITWTLEDGTVLYSQKILYGEQIPAYDGDTPYKKSDDKYDYVFIGWGTECDAVTGDTHVVALFEAKRNGLDIEDLWWAWLLVAIAILVLLIIVIKLLCKRNKRKKKPLLLEAGSSEKEKQQQLSLDKFIVKELVQKKDEKATDNAETKKAEAKPTDAKVDAKKTETKATEQPKTADNKAKASKPDAKDKK